MSNRGSVWGKRHFRPGLLFRLLTLPGSPWGQSANCPEIGAPQCTRGVPFTEAISCASGLVPLRSNSSIITNQRQTVSTVYSEEHTICVTLDKCQNVSGYQVSKRGAYEGQSKALDAKCHEWSLARGTPSKAVLKFEKTLQTRCSRMYVPGWYVPREELKIIAVDFFLIIKAVVGHCKFSGKSTHPAIITLTLGIIYFWYFFCVFLYFLCFIKNRDTALRCLYSDFSPKILLHTLM